MTYPIGLGQKLLEIDLPEKYRDDDFVQQLCNVIGAELEFFDRWIQFGNEQDWQNYLNGLYLFDSEGILAQWFARTVRRTATTDYITWWEQMLGIPVDTTMLDSDRRNNIRARMSQRASAPTVEFMIGQVQRYVQSAAISVQASTYSFTVKILNPHATLPVSVQNNITNAVNAAKPAHMAFTIQFSEEDWLSLANRDWNTIGNVDWNTFNF